MENQNQDQNQNQIQELDEVQNTINFSSSSLEDVIQDPPANEDNRDAQDLNVSQPIQEPDEDVYLESAPLGEEVKTEDPDAGIYPILDDEEDADEEDEDEEDAEELEEEVFDTESSSGAGPDASVGVDEELSFSDETQKDFSASKFVIVKEIIENVKNELSRINELLGASVSEKDLEEVSKKLTTTKTSRARDEASQMKVIEGVFDGQNMIGGDGEHYSVPANYASKSKMVEGDLLKLTVLQDGSFVYKQISPIERRRVVGTLACDESGEQFFVLAEGKRWKVLRASITYFKGEPGDEVTIVIPKDTPSQWGAVENIIKK